MEWSYETSEANKDTRSDGVDARIGSCSRSRRNVRWLGGPSFATSSCHAPLPVGGLQKENNGRPMAELHEWQRPQRALANCGLESLHRMHHVCTKSALSRVACSYVVIKLGSTNKARTDEWLIQRSLSIVHGRDGAHPIFSAHGQSNKKPRELCGPCPTLERGGEVLRPIGGYLFRGSRKLTRDDDAQTRRQPLSPPAPSAPLFRFRAHRAALVAEESVRPDRRQFRLRPRHPRADEGPEEKKKSRGHALGFSHRQAESARSRTGKKPRSDNGRTRTPSPKECDLGGVKTSFHFCVRSAKAALLNQATFLRLALRQALGDETDDEETIASSAAIKVDSSPSEH
ncbi:hypothetical protein HPB50_004449 [Hyalomma asiaticum]|uniref:Uncharacterized protein n=1 Tax=Hyalomma asiaticum TaxID=266040 RepID=A0ACB7TAX7_HYAAI|nr:hypothetical protein HPB50_004449 [Hyalomma asiaticum]